jgi:hypothetical protein
VGHHPATWEEIVERFSGAPGSGRAVLTEKLFALRDSLRSCGVTGSMLLNGTYVSAREEPRDFDVLLVAPDNIQAMKEADPRLGVLLDAEHAEKVGGYSLFYVPRSSPDIGMVTTFWNITSEGIAKGSVEVEL